MPGAMKTFTTSAIVGAALFEIGSSVDTEVAVSVNMHSDTLSEKAERRVRRRRIREVHRVRAQAENSLQGEKKDDPGASQTENNLEGEKKDDPGASQTESILEGEKKEDPGRSQTENNLEEEEDKAVSIKMNRNGGEGFVSLSEYQAGSVREKEEEKTQKKLAGDAGSVEQHPPEAALLEEEEEETQKKLAGDAGSVEQDPPEFALLETEDRCKGRSRESCKPEEGCAVVRVLCPDSQKEFDTCCPQNNHASCSGKEDIRCF